MASHGFGVGFADWKARFPYAYTAPLEIGDDILIGALMSLFCRRLCTRMCHVYANTAPYNGTAYTAKALKHVWENGRIHSIVAQFE